MPAEASAPHSIRFGVFDFLPKSGELFKAGVRIKLQQQPAQFLLILLQQPGQLVTRDEIRDALWPSETFVDFEHSLGTAVRKIRAALGDAAENPIFIETIPKRGYRFIAPVQVSENNPPQHAPIPALIPAPALPLSHAPEPSVPQQNRAPSQTKPRWLPALVSVAVVAAMLFIFAWLNPRLDQRAHADSPKIRSLAVLPLQNLSGDATQDFLADGMTDELITELGKSTALRVISRTSVTQYKGTKKSLQQIARELNVDAILEGTVVRSANHVRITANLVQSSPEAHLMAQTYESENGDLFSLQHQVANSVAQQIQVTLRPPDASHHARSIDPKAQDLFYRGVYALGSSGAGSHPTAVEYLQGAVSIDPSFADAYAALAITYAVWMPGDAGPRVNMLKARQAALKSISLDNSLAVGHMALAYVDMNYDWNFAEAEREFQLSLRDDPNSTFALGFYARELVVLGRTDEGLQQARHALEVQPYIGTDYPAWVFYLAHHYNESLEIGQRLVGMAPNNPWAHWQLAANYEQLGRQKEAVDEYVRFEILSGASSQRVKRLQDGLAKSGVKGFWQANRDDYARSTKSGYAPPVLAAGVCMRLNDIPCALQYLEKGFREHDDLMIDLNVDPIFAALHTDPHFQQLVQRVGLPH